MSRLAKLPVSLPTHPVPTDTQPAEVAEQYQDIFERLESNSFVRDAVWRDVYGVTGTLRSFYGNQSVYTAWCECVARVQAHSFQVHAEQARTVKTLNGESWLDCPFSFQTASEPPLLCSGSLSLAKDGKGSPWKIWVMNTVLEQIIGVPNVDEYSLSSSADPKVHAINTDHAPHHETNANTVGHSKEAIFDCVIVGGGQAGLNTAGRCKALGLSYVVLERNDEVGDNWRQRYDSARLHTIREYAHLPFDRTFTLDYPQFLGKDDLAKGYSSWVERFDINIWLSTTLLQGSWDSSSRTWNLHICCNNVVRQAHLTCSFVIMAVGVGGQIPNMPDLPGRGLFQGTVLHSEQYKSAQDWARKDVVVVGTANTAHDIAEDMLDAGCASTTMVQRSETYVLPGEWFVAGQERTYNPTVSTALADRMGFSAPNAVFRLVTMANLHAMTRKNLDRFEALEKAGFKVDTFGDPVWHIYERLGGHYMDVGASKKISDGLIRMKSDAALTHFTPNGLGFVDGSEVPADVVVFATGFDLNVRDRVREIFGDGTADMVGEFSVMDNEGELSGAYKFQHPGLACNGGAIGPSRWYSRFLALSMKAAVLGTPFQVYRDTPIPLNNMI